MAGNFKTMDEYIDVFPENVQQILKALRQTTKDAVPEAKETINYQISTVQIFVK